MKTYVYFNLRKKCFSIKRKGIVIAHADKVYVTNAEFKVSEAGRRRVLKDKRKNVHAYVVGDVCSGSIKDGVEVTYNPYLFKNFVTKIESRPVRSAESVLLTLTPDKKAKIVASKID
jgi:hypothetical protein